MTSIYQPSRIEQIQLLKEQTRLTGALHEAQVLQLKLWPMVMFQTAVGSSFTWDPVKKVVNFKVEHPAKRMPKLEIWKAQVTTLNTWVQTLLGDEWHITVSCNGKTFKGTRSLRSVKRDRPQPG